MMLTHISYLYRVQLELKFDINSFPESWPKNHEDQQFY